MKRFDTVTNWQRNVVILLSIGTCALWLLSMAYDDRYLFLAVGTSLLVISLLPIALSRAYDWCCPWTAVIVAIIYGGTFPSACMSLGLPDEEFLQKEIFLREPPEFFVWPSLLLVASFVCLAAGYFSWPSRSRTSRPIRLDFETEPKRLLLVCLVCGVVTTLAFGAYFALNGGLSGGLSTKRSGLHTLDVGADNSYRSHGYLRHLAKSGNIALLLLAAYWCRYKPAAGTVGSVLQTCALGCLLTLSIAFPFYSSSRAGMLWVVVGLAVVTYYMRRKIISVKAVGLVGLMLMVTVFVTAVRNGGGESNEKIVKRISHLFLNRHGPDVAVTAHIINALPNTLDYQYGKTISAWFLAPIPRELFPNKPLVHFGPIIGQSVYKLGLTGIPTGLTAELYWNFHVMGVLFGSLIAGFYLRWTYEFFMRIQLDTVLLAPVYAFSVFPIGYKMVSVGVGPGLIMPIVDFVFASFVVWMSSVMVQRQELSSNQTQQFPGSKVPSLAGKQSISNDVLPY